jgi:hypothetical protein
MAIKDNTTPKSNLVLSDKKNNRLSLRVKRKISTSRNFKINEQEMKSKKGKNHYTDYYHNGSDGLNFKVTVLFKKSEVKLMKQLDAWWREMRPFKIAFDVDLSLRLPLVSRNWIVKDIDINQEDRNYTSWDVTFRTYNPPKKVKAVKNELLDRTSKSYKWTKKCKKHYKNLTYKKMKGKKATECTKLLNQILLECGVMRKPTRLNKKGKKVKYTPDKYIPKTSYGVKNFKKQWNRYKLKPKLAKNKKGRYTDTIDKNTYKAIGNYKKLKSAKKKK